MVKARPLPKGIGGVGQAAVIRAYQAHAWIRRRSLARRKGQPGEKPGPLQTPKGSNVDKTHSDNAFWNVPFKIYQDTHELTWSRGISPSVEGLTA